MSRRLVLALLLLMVAVPGAAAAARPTGCGGGVSEVYGEVIISGFAPGMVRLEWSLWEDGATREYRLSRYPSGCDRRSCGTRLGKIRPSRELGRHSYQFVDTAPAGIWRYVIDVVRLHGPSCRMESAEIVVEVPPTCDAAALCSQVEASFAGSVISGAAVAATVVLEWLTHAETPAMEGYRLSRYNCGLPRDCTTEIGTINATGTCGQVMLHSVTDSLPTGDWTYQLEVLDSGGRTACTLRLPAPAAPPTSR